MHPPSELRLMCVLAHPDDESLGTGGALALSAAEGIATYLVTATRGERGRFGDAVTRPAPDVVGRTREAELRAAAEELGLREVCFLDYPDGALDGVDAAEAIARIAGHLRRVRPQVVVTFGPEGAYGHTDHIAISQFTTAAVVAAADPSWHLAVSRQIRDLDRQRAARRHCSPARQEKRRAVGSLDFAYRRELR